MEISKQIALTQKNYRNLQRQQPALIHAVNVWLYAGYIPPMMDGDGWKSQAQWEAAVKQFRKMVENGL